MEYSFNYQETFTGTYYINPINALRFTYAQMNNIQKNGYSDYLDRNESKWYVIPSNFLYFHSYWDIGYSSTGNAALINIEVYDKRGTDSIGDFYGRLIPTGGFSKVLAWRRYNANDFFIKVTNRSSNSSLDFKLKIIPAYNSTSLFYSLSPNCRCSPFNFNSIGFDTYNGMTYEVCRKTLGTYVSAVYFADNRGPRNNIGLDTILTYDRYREQPLKNGYYSTGDEYLSDVMIFALTGTCTQFVNNSPVFNAPCDNGYVWNVLKNPCPPALLVKFSTANVGVACNSTAFRTLYYKTWLNVNTVLYQDTTLLTPALSGYYSDPFKTTVFYISGNNGRITKFFACPSEFDGGYLTYYWMMSATPNNSGYLCSTDWISGFKPAPYYLYENEWAEFEAGISNTSPSEPYYIKIYSTEDPRMVFSDSGWGSPMTIGSYLWADNAGTIPVPDGEYRTPFTNTTHGHNDSKYEEWDGLNWESMYYWGMGDPVFSVRNGVVTNVSWCNMQLPFFKGSSIKDICAGADLFKNESRYLPHYLDFTFDDKPLGLYTRDYYEVYPYIKKTWEDSSDVILLWFDAFSRRGYPLTQETYWNSELYGAWSVIGTDIFYDAGGTMPVEDCWIASYNDVRTALYENMRTRKNGWIIFNGDKYEKTRIQNGKSVEITKRMCSTGYVANSGRDPNAATENYITNKPRFPIIPVRSLNTNSLSHPVIQAPLSSIVYSKEYPGEYIELRTPYILLSSGDYLYFNAFDLTPVPDGYYLFKLVDGSYDGYDGEIKYIVKNYTLVGQIDTKKVDIWQLAEVKGNNGQVKSVITSQTVSVAPTDGGGGTGGTGGGGGGGGGGTGGDLVVVDVDIKSYTTSYSLYYAETLENICEVLWGWEGTVTVASFYGDVYHESKVLDVGSILYSNDELTVPVPDGYYKTTSAKVAFKVSGGSGKITSIESCPLIYTLYYGKTVQDACTNIVTTIITSNVEIKFGTTLLKDSNLNDLKYADDGYYKTTNNNILYTVVNGVVVSEQREGCPFEIFSYYGLSKFTASEKYGTIIPIYVKIGFRKGSRVYGDFNLTTSVKNGYYRLSDDKIVFINDNIVEEITTPYTKSILYPGNTLEEACKNTKQKIYVYYYSKTLTIGEDLYSDKYLENPLKDGFYRISDSYVYEVVDNKLSNILTCNELRILHYSNKNAIDTCYFNEPVTAYVASLMAGVSNKKSTFYSDYNLSIPLKENGYYRVGKTTMVYLIENGEIIKTIETLPCPNTSELYYGSSEINACYSKTKVPIYYQKGLNDFVNVYSIGTEYIDVDPEGVFGGSGYVSYEENEDGYTERIYNSPIRNVNREASERTFVKNTNKQIIDTNIDTQLIDGIYYDVEMRNPAAAGFYRDDFGTVYKVSGTLGLITERTYCPAAFTTTDGPIITPQSTTKQPWCSHTTTRLPILIKPKPANFTTIKSENSPRSNILIDPIFNLSDDVIQSTVTTTPIPQTTQIPILSTTINNIIENKCKDICSTLKY